MFTPVKAGAYMYQYDINNAFSAMVFSLITSIS